MLYVFLSIQIKTQIYSKKNKEEDEEEKLPYV